MSGAGLGTSWRSETRIAWEPIEISSSQGRTRRRENLYLSQDALGRWRDNATGQLCTCDAHQAACGRAIAEGRPPYPKACEEHRGRGTDASGPCRPELLRIPAAS